MRSRLKADVLTKNYLFNPKKFQKTFFTHWVPKLELAYLQKLSISAKSPLRKVLSDLIFLYIVGYNNISWRPHDPLPKISVPPGLTIMNMPVPILNTSMPIPVLALSRAEYVCSLSSGRGPRLLAPDCSRS